MTGHVRKRGAVWEVLLEHGELPALQCPTCRRGRRYWSGEEQPARCPQCDGELVEVVARRQELLPGRYATKKLAAKGLRDELQEREHGTHVAPVALTVRQYLEDRWLARLAGEELTSSTTNAYKLHVRRIVAHLGDIALQALTRDDVALFSAKLATEKGQRVEHLSPATRRAILAVLHRALGDAVAHGLLRANPADSVKRPKVRRAEMHTWTREELASFLAATSGDRLSSLWRLLAMTGLRRGEALGLHWSDVDLEGGSLRVQRQRVHTGGSAKAGEDVEERQTKTDRPRHVSIDAATVATLRLQSAQQLEDAASWGAAWRSEGHVFTRENGEPWTPDRVTVLFARAVTVAGVPRIRLHDLRHTHATLALQAGVHPKVVQERLGHSTITQTMDCYSHVLPTMQESAAELVAALVDTAPEGVAR